MWMLKKIKSQKHRSYASEMFMSHEYMVNHPQTTQSCISPLSFF